MSRSRDGTWLTTRSPIFRTPREMSSSPATIRSAVVFPQPDGPTRTMNSPSWISRSRPLTAVVPSAYVFVTPSNETPATQRPPGSMAGVLTNGTGSAQLRNSDGIRRGGAVRGALFDLDGEARPGGDAEGVGDARRRMLRDVRAGARVAEVVA